MTMLVQVLLVILIHLFHQQGDNSCKIQYEWTVWIQVLDMGYHVVSFAITCEFMDTLVCPNCQVPTWATSRANVILPLELSSVSWTHLSTPFGYHLGVVELGVILSCHLSHLFCLSFPQLLQIFCLIFCFIFLNNWYLCMPWSFSFLSCLPWMNERKKDISVVLWMKERESCSLGVTALLVM
jgi:hypothetical protein